MMYTRGVSSMLGYAQIAKLNALSLSRVFSIKLCQGDTLLALGKPLGYCMEIYTWPRLPNYS